MEDIAKIVGIISLGFFLVFYNAICIVLGWQWFISPLGVSEISILHAIGISCFISLFISSKNEGEELKDVFIRNFINKTFLLFIMFLVSFGV